MVIDILGVFREVTMPHFFIFLVFPPCSTHTSWSGYLWFYVGAFLWVFFSWVLSLNYNSGEVCSNIAKANHTVQYSNKNENNYFSNSDGKGRSWSNQGRLGHPKLAQVELSIIEQSRRLGGGLIQRSKIRMKGRVCDEERENKQITVIKSWPPQALFPSFWGHRWWEGHTFFSWFSCWSSLAWQEGDEPFSLGSRQDKQERGVGSQVLPCQLGLASLDNDLWGLKLCKWSLYAGLAIGKVWELPCNHSWFLTHGPHPADCFLTPGMVCQCLCGKLPVSGCISTKCLCRGQSNQSNVSGSRHCDSPHAAIPVSIPAPTHIHSQVFWLWLPEFQPWLPSGTSAAQSAFLTTGLSLQIYI